MYIDYLWTNTLYCNILIGNPRMHVIKLKLVLYYFIIRANTLMCNLLPNICYRYIY